MDHCGRGSKLVNLKEIQIPNKEIKIQKEEYTNKARWRGIASDFPAATLFIIF